MTQGDNGILRSNHYMFRWLQDTGTFSPIAKDDLYPITLARIYKSNCLDILEWQLAFFPLLDSVVKVLAIQTEVFDKYGPSL